MEGFPFSEMVQSNIDVEDYIIVHILITLDKKWIDNEIVKLTPHYIVEKITQILLP